MADAALVEPPVKAAVEIEWEAFPKVSGKTSINTSGD